MARKGRGRLSAEDRALWSKVVAGATPMPRTATPKGPARLLPPAKPALPAPEAQEPLPEFRIGEKARSTGSERALTGASPAPRMDARAFGRLKRGKLVPEARIDLHGMTVAAAHAALVAFVLRAAGDGLRLVLVITGKGREDGDGPVPEQRGILRRQVPHWLQIPPLVQVVLQVEPAHRRHGGSGAYYVYLRRRQ